MLTALLTLLLQPTTLPADVEMKPAADVPLAVEVFNAHGGEAWPEVAELRYTFNVEQNGETVLSRQHVWNKADGSVTVDGTTADTTANPAAENHDAEAFKAWTNDAYWLVAPLKLMDGGVRAADVSDDGDTRKLMVGFENVGLTPGDRYVYEVNPDGTIAAWTYLPAGDETGKRFEWSGYDMFGPLTLSLDHVTADGFRVVFTDVTVR